MREGRIDFAGVTYHYKHSEPLFNDFNLHIAPGEKIGLVGRSGSGKSTLIKLLSRYYDIQKGEISIDGQNIAEVTQKSLRASIALIPQDPSLFNRTIMENIRYGSLRATDEEVLPLPVAPVFTILSCRCRPVTIPRSANAVSCFPAANASGLPLPVRF